MPSTGFPTALGACRLAWNEAGLTAVALPEPGGAEPGPLPDGDPPVAPAAAPDWVRGVVARVQRHLEGQLQDFRSVPLDHRRVPPFAHRVYEAARAVPAGRTRTYGELAADLGQPPGGSRAIGAALAANPWPLIVPCHRIVGARGRLIGFSAAGGVRTKARLLAIEGAQLIAE
jgi:methylated-DNA-[protein]-cysteine S-methyltransferase